MEIDFEAVDPACFGKSRYVTKADAVKQRERVLRRGLKKAAGLHIYRCEHCHHWHLGATRVKRCVA